MCGGYVRADVGSGGDQRCEISWSWNCRLWRAALGGCRELNSRPLEEQQAHPLSPEPALPVVLFGFMIIESCPFWDLWLRGWDIFISAAKYSLSPRPTGGGWERKGCFSVRVAKLRCWNWEMPTNRVPKYVKEALWGQGELFLS